MSQDPFPGHGQDGEEPLPGSGEQNGSWDADDDPAEDAHLDHLAAGIEAEPIEIPPEDGPVQGVTISLAEVTDPAAADTAGFTKGGAADTMSPGAALAALAEAACAELGALTSNQVLGLAGAGKRLAALGTWIELAAASEFAARNRTGDAPGCVAGETLSEFAGDELAPELKLTPLAAAAHLAYAHTVSRRLPATFAALRAGRIDGYRVKIIAEATEYLTDADAAEADQILALSAAELTYGRLRHAAARLVMMLDPEAARRHKDEAAKNARVNCFREQAGTAGISGRDLPVDQTLASWANVKARALDYRTAGIPGTITELRTRAFLDLLQERDARDTLSAEAGTGHAGTDGANGDGNGGANGADGTSTGDRNGGTRGPNPRPDPAGPGGAARTPTRPPLAALINITVPLATLLGTSRTPGEAAGFGLLDAETTQDLVAAASAHPATRWCATVAGADGTAAAHGCAAGQHPYHPGQYPASGPGRPRAPSGETGRGAGNRDGPGRDWDGPAPSQTGQAADFLRRLRVKLAPIAKGTCDHTSYEPGYRPSRKLRHLVNARTARCHFPCCSRPAAECDADHTVPWPAGPTC